MAAEPGAKTPRAAARRVSPALAGLLVVSAMAGGAFLAWPAGGQDARPSAQAGHSCGIVDSDHAEWTALLRQHVHDGRVDYRGFAARGPALDSYLRTLESACRGGYATWSQPERLAYWINVYNAYTVRLVLDHYPIDSIRSIGVLPLAAFRETFIPLEGLRGHRLSLNDVEHDILRGEFADPRIHFAIVCASRSCPALRSEAYRAANLDRQLDEAARAFMRDRTKNHFDSASRTLHLSSIFRSSTERRAERRRTEPRASRSRSITRRATSCATSVPAPTRPTASCCRRACSSAS
ncbi:MAG: DUF547 domain-containing protein, partial [Deltaproteobacteria bacterium]|nr:DUF547 domain-containing protein [Deltaproteobacteria bacterium]